MVSCIVTMNGGGLVSTEKLQFLPQEMFVMKNDVIKGLDLDGRQDCYYDFSYGNVISNETDYVAIPSVVGGVDVRGIGSSYTYEIDCDNSLWFRGKVVIIPFGVEWINDGLFDGGTGEQNVVALPNTVKRIGHWAFKSCNGLSIVVPESCYRIDDGAFLGARDVNVPKSVSEIGYRSFNFPPEFEDGGYYEMDGDFMVRGSEVCQYFGKSEEVRLPEGYKVVEDNLFRDYSGKKVEIPDSYREIGHNAFLRAKISEILMSPRIDLIHGHAFWGAEVKEVKFEEGLRAIYEGAFGRSGIEDIYLPSSLSILDENAFFDLRKTCTIHCASEMVRQLVQSKITDGHGINVVLE